MKHIETLYPYETIDLLKQYHFPPYITLAHLFNAPHGWSLKPRKLSQFQLQYVVEGVAEYQIGNKLFVTKIGDLLFHRPNELHSVTTVTNQSYVCISVVFHFGSSSFPLNDLLGEGHYLGNFLVNDPIVIKLKQLITNYHQLGLVNHILCQGIFLEILYNLSKHKEQRGTQPVVTNKIMSKLILAKNYIENHFSEDLKLTDLEQITGLSRNYVIMQFKKEFGKTPLQYVTWYRIQKAIQLAVHSNLTISEIAHKVGYADLHTFGKMFKKNTGSSLSQFCAALYTEYP